MDISLVICTRNRADRLPACLQSLLALRYAGAWECVLVDNGSTDGTAGVLAAFAATAPMRVQVVQQPVKGLGNARNAGIVAAQGAIVAFTDDDCYPAPEFLQAIAAAFRVPGLGYTSGRVLLHDPTDFPSTISLSTEPESIEAGQYVRPGVIKGANMAFRRQALLDIQGFDPLFGSGASFPSEDCDAAARASLAGWSGRYEPSIVVSHHHGRKAHEADALYRSYDIGRGAYHTKLLLQCRAPTLALRGWGGILRRIRWRPSSAWWETYGAARYATAWARQHLKSETIVDTSASQMLDHAPATMVRVISLRDADERRQAFTVAAADAGLPWSFFDAARDAQPPLAYLPERALVAAGRLLRPGEVGCYASHFEVWRAFLASDARQLLVFEDDVMVDWPAVRRLVAMDLAAMDVHILKLFASYPTRSRTVLHKLYSDHSHLVQLRGYSYGTQAYLLTRDAAQRLVAGCAVVDMPIDWAMSRYWRHGHAVHALVPSPVIERMLPSSIGHPPPFGQAGPPGWLVRHWCKRISERLRRAVADLGLGWKSRFAPPDDARRKQ